MKANELRIGNLITIDNSVYWLKLRDIPLIVTHIGQTMNIKGESSHSVGCEHINQKTNTYYETYSQFIENIKPIPLTEEWLLRFGFEKGNKVYKDAFSINLLKTDLYLRKCYYGGYYWGFNLENKLDCEFNDAKSVKYVHQLQNLYFALTGEELTI